MPDYTLSPNMSLPLPIVGQDPGPDYATNQNTAFSLVDSHDHTPGKGVPITPAGLSITSDLPFNSYNATELRTSRYTAQDAPLSDPSDLGCVYVSGVDLYYNDGDGNQVRITQSGGVAGSPGSIANLVSPASASYVALDSTFVWESDASTPANMDNGSVTIREVVSNGFGVTLSAPAGIAADYTITFPLAPPASTKMLTMDAAGNIGTYGVDNVTIEVSSSNLQVKDGGITPPKMGAAGQQVSSSSGTYSRNTNSFADVTNLSCSITTYGRPVKIVLKPDGSNTLPNASFIGVGGTPASGYLQVLRGSTVVGLIILQQPDNATIMCLPPGSLNMQDEPAAGTYTYKVQAYAQSGATIYVFHCKLFVEQD